MKEREEKSQENVKKTVKGFQVLEEECIWMKAGVVNFRLCDNAYDCYSCPFDKGMKKAMKTEAPSKEKQETSWVEHLKWNYADASRPCRHALTGRVTAPKVCTKNYECYHCAYDQMLDEADLLEPLQAPKLNQASGYRMAQDYYYHMGHCWARFEHSGRVMIGFDDFLVKVFGAPQSVMLPYLGAKLAQNQVGWSFERGEHKAAILSPVSGTVLAVNQRAKEHPEISQEDPYHEGWLMVVEPKMPKRDLKRLYFGNESIRWMEHESKKLLSLIGPEYERLAATGAEAMHDLYGQFPDLGWDRLAKTFLHTEKV
jgi:glycine cleavage system H lipoate-binding protein